MSMSLSGGRPLRTGEPRIPGSLEILISLYDQRSLIFRLAAWEIKTRYRSSLLGTFWIVITPLLMLGMYTLVFSTVFPSKWGISGNTSQFALVLFAGLIVFQFLAELLTRAPGLFLEDISYIKKVIFPLEILPVVAVLSATATAFVSLALLFVFYCVSTGIPPVKILLIPCVLVPLGAIGLGGVYLIASLGVFLRDLRHIMPPVVQALMFLSPVFYPLAQLPGWIRGWVALNPATVPIESLRAALFHGIDFDPIMVWVHAIAATLVLLAGFATFCRLRSAFADVV